MRPSWSLGALPLESETTPPIPPDRVNEEGPKLTVQKRNDVKILDHSYTPTAWTKVGFYYRIARRSALTSADYDSSGKLFLKHRETFRNGR